MGTWMQIKYENTSMPAMQLLNQSQFIIIIQNWELGYCPDKRQRNIWKGSYKQHRIPLSSPTWAQRTDTHWELLMVMERGRRNVNNLPLLTHVRLRSQSGFAGMEPMKRNTGHPQEGMLSWHWLMHLHSSLFFFPWIGLIYGSIRTVDCISYLYIETIAVIHETW